MRIASLILVVILLFQGCNNNKEFSIKWKEDINFLNEELSNKHINFFLS